MENETSSDQCREAGRLQVMTSMGTDIKKWNCDKWRALWNSVFWLTCPFFWEKLSNNRKKFHTASKPFPITQETPCNSMSVISLLLKAALKPVALSLSVFLLLLYTSLTQCIINHNRDSLITVKWRRFGLLTRSAINSRCPGGSRSWSGFYAVSRLGRGQTCRKENRKKTSTQSTIMK